MNRPSANVLMIPLVAGLCVLLNGRLAIAQDQPVRGWETGLDVYSASRSGEAAFYGGGFGGNHGLMVRFSALDETNVVPCSIGIMYEYVGFRKTASHIKPIGGLSLNRIFSCASEAQEFRSQSPPMHGSRFVTGGVQMPVFKTEHIAGSLRVMGFAGTLFGHSSDADSNTKGIVLGAVLHTP